MGISWRAGLTTQVPIIKPAKRHETQKQYEYTKYIALSKQNKNNITAKSNIKELLGQKH